MKKIKIFGVILVALILVMSCTTAQFSGLQMNKDMGSFNVVGNFDEKIWVNEFFGAPGGVNVFNISSTSMDGPVFDAIQKEIQKAGGDAAVNITIKQEASFINVVLASITGTIWAPCTVHVSGTIVKFEN